MNGGSSAASESRLVASARFALTGAAPRARLREPSLLFSRDKRQGISYISFRGIWVLRVDNRVTVIHPEHAILSTPKPLSRTVKVDQKYSDMPKK